MKVFMSKLKKTNKLLLTIYLVIAIEYIISLVFFTKSLLLLVGIETIFRILVLALFYIIFTTYLIAGIALLFTKNTKKFAIISVIITVLVPILAVGAYTINSFYKEIDAISKEMVTYTGKLIALKEKKITSDSTLAMINDPKDIEGNILAKKIIEKENLKNEIKEYDDYLEMIALLYDEEVDGVFVPNNYIILFSSEDLFENLGADTYVVYTYAEERVNEDNIVINDKDLTEPFTILLVGVDSATESRLSDNADTIMLLTFNPHTLNATVFSIPRDTYVPIACRNNAYAKINSSAVRGISCVIDTVEALTGIDIDYYVTINFTGVVDLVEALGGITVDIEAPNFNINHGHDCKGIICEQDSKRKWGENTIFIKPGIQDLNGEQALAYARNRGQYIGSDFARNRHQQQIIEQVARKSKSIRSLDKFQEILGILSKNMDTNMSTNKILSFYNLGKSIIFSSKSDNDFISVEKTYLETYNLPVYLTNIRAFTSAQGHYKSSLDEIVKAMKVNLGLEKQELIKTFSYSFDENYEVRVLGKSKRDNNRLETLPNFTGKAKSDIESWCNARNIIVNYESVNEGSTRYNPLYPSGYVIDQSVHHGVLMASSSISNITIYVMNNTSKNTPIMPPPVAEVAPEECDDPEDIICNPILTP